MWTSRADVPPGDASRFDLRAPRAEPAATELPLRESAAPAAVGGASRTTLQRPAIPLDGEPGGHDARAVAQL
jgi:hypothetical protein